MRVPHWEQGRQGTGYRKLRLAQGKHWDLYVLDLPAGINVPTHTDVVPGRQHWRASFVLCGEQSLQVDGAIRLGRLVVFRPDRPHSLPVLGRRRIELSFGVAL